MRMEGQERMPKRKDDPAQKSIDFDWCRRDRTIRDCRIETLRDKHGDPVSMTTTKMVLTIINSHAGGREAWISFETLAGKVGKSLRTVKRAVEALCALGVLMAEYKQSAGGRPCNHYRIVWSELAILVPPRTVPFSPGNSAIFAGKSASSGTQSANALKLSKEARGSAIGFPDFSEADIGTPEGVRVAFLRLGDRYPLADVALAAAIAVRRATVSPAGLFVKILRDGWGEFTPSDLDHAQAKVTLRVLGGLYDGPHGNERSRQWEASGQEAG